MTLDQLLIAACVFLSGALGVLYRREQQRMDKLEVKVTECEKAHLKAVEERVQVWHGFYQIQRAIHDCRSIDCPNKKLQALMPTDSHETITGP